jgi:hypothetical protein
MNSQEQQQLFTFSQCRERWGGDKGPSQWTLMRAADRGELKTIYVGARRFVPLAEVLRVEQNGLGQSRRRRGKR